MPQKFITVKSRCKTARERIPALPISCSHSLGQLLPLSVAWFSHLRNGQITGKFLSFSRASRRSFPNPHKGWRTAPAHCGLLTLIVFIGRISTEHPEKPRDDS